MRFFLICLISLVLIGCGTTQRVKQVAQTPPKDVECAYLRSGMDFSLECKTLIEGQVTLDGENSIWNLLQ